MYSGTTLTKFSGRVLGAHQKIDRVARKQLTKLLPDNSAFPAIRSILHFEGNKGPDAIKRKSPAKDEPWHFYNPFDSKDSRLVDLIEEHYKRLVKELKAGNKERSAFEAAWLAHALVDGLTPAHHYPYEEKLIELRGGLDNDSRTSIKDKWVIPGDTRRAKVKNNWKMWGPRGLVTAHGLFEMGIATLIMPLTFSEIAPKKKDLEKIQELGVTQWFQRTAREVAVLDMYQNYIKRGWTPKLAWQVRHKLGPLIVQMITLTWYSAAVDAGLVKET